MILKGNSSLLTPEGWRNFGHQNILPGYPLSSLVPLDSFIKGLNPDITFRGTMRITFCPRSTGTGRVLSASPSSTRCNASPRIWLLKGSQSQGAKGMELCWSFGGGGGTKRRGYRRGFVLMRLPPSDPDSWH